MSMPGSCIAKAKRTAAYLRRLHHEIQALRRENSALHKENFALAHFADKVRDTSTYAPLRAEADVLLSRRDLA